jgi:hypothetical protein
MTWHRLLALAVVFAVALVFALSAPTSEGHQAVKMYRIGYLGTNPGFNAAFVDGLRALGYVEGRDFVVWIDERCDVHGRLIQPP